MEEFSIGIKRFKDMDEASTRFAQSDYQGAKGFIASFIGTVDESSEAAKKLTESFDEIHLKRKQEHRDLDKRIEEIGFLEQNVGAREGHMHIDVIALGDTIETCWKIGREEALFHD